MAALGGMLVAGPGHEQGLLGSTSITLSHEDWPSSPDPILNVTLCCIFSFLLINEWIVSVNLSMALNGYQDDFVSSLITFAYNELRLRFGGIK